ncbi:hypothetical protein C5748_23975 [Phyllobacterium phragmitis]|uniref:Uncharacterized protein n=1 Tax=Phyllobacterium phragmitis TaxID=2670329 RepID=A0A2S9IKI3_9HYPH|nr:hypothetical protein C5748_23975 [Phyllobacterium phragmitis]
MRFTGDFTACVRSLASFSLFPRHDFRNFAFRIGVLGVVDIGRIALGVTLAGFVEWIARFCRQ